MNQSRMVYLNLSTYSVLNIEVSLIGFNVNACTCRSMVKIFSGVLLRIYTTDIGAIKLDLPSYQKLNLSI